MSKRISKKLLDAVFRHYAKPESETILVNKMRTAMHHALFCGDLSHGHGVIKVSWSPPKTKLATKQDKEKP